MIIVLFSAGVINVSAAKAVADTLQPTPKIPTFECLIQPEKIVRISSPIDGILSEVYVDDSDHVSKGQKLAQLESSVQKAAVEVAKSKALRNDEIHLRETDLAFTKRKLDRIIDLHEKHSVSPSVLTSMRNILCHLQKKTGRKLPSLWQNLNYKKHAIIIRWPILSTKKLKAPWKKEQFAAQLMELLSLVPLHRENL